MDVFYEPMIRSQSFIEHVLLGCDLHNCSSFFYSPYVGHESQSVLELGISFLPSWVGSDKTPVGYTLLKV